MATQAIAKDYGFPGCCGVTHLHKINIEVTKAGFLKWLKNTHENICLGGLVTAVSKTNDVVLEAKLKEFGFVELSKTQDERLWYRRIKFSSMLY